MTVIKALDSRGQTLHDLFMRSRSGNVLPGLILRDRSVPAAVKSRARHSDTFDSSNFVSIQKTRVADIVEVPFLGRYLQGSVESSYHRGVGATELGRGLTEALQLVEKLYDECATEDSGATKSSSGASHFDSKSI